MATQRTRKVASLLRDSPAAARAARLRYVSTQERGIPGQRLFQYRDGGRRYRPVTSTDVNLYIYETMGDAFTAKEFRTWAGTVAAMFVLLGCRPCRSAHEGRRMVTQAIESVARRLGNTQAVCKKCYIHPTVIEAYMSGTLHRDLTRCLAKAQERSGLRREECAVLAFLEQAAPRLAAA